MQARKNVLRPIIDGQKIRVILLLVEDSSKKRKISDSDKTSSPTKNESKPDVSNKQKTKKKEPHAFIKPLRYFETNVE